jgi:LacI family transcriptional regulator
MRIEQTGVNAMTRARKRGKGMTVTPSGKVKVTLRMVADACGVSASTVSRILNGTAQVSEAKREAVQHAIANLGFVPNPVARGLAGGRTFSVGVVTQAIDSPFYGPALRAIEQVLYGCDYCPLFMSGDWNAKAERRCIDMLLARRVDGLIILSGRLSNAALKELARQVPVVVTGRNLTGPQLHSLNFDNFSGAKLATSYLIGKGHRRIAFILGDLAHPDVADRQRGYRAALEEAGIAYDDGLVLPGTLVERSGGVAVERLLGSGEPFSAIFAANDQMAFGAALALYQRGFHIPNDVSLIGFDDLVVAEHAIPPLTTVNQAPHELGRLAAISLLQLINGEKPEAVLPAPKLVTRASVRQLEANDIERGITALSAESQRGVVITDVAGRIVRVNPAFARLTGYTADEAVGKKPGVLLGSGRQTADFYRRMWDALAERGKWVGELWNRRKDGKLYREQLEINAITGPDGVTTHYVGRFSELDPMQAG